MAAFYVGQRVRCVHSEVPEHKGREGLVIAVSYSGYVTTGDLVENGLRVKFVGDEWPALGAAWRFEPILYDGNQLVEWSECLWQPEGQAA